MIILTLAINKVLSEESTLFWEADMPELTNQDVMGIVRRWQRNVPEDVALKCNNENCWDILEPIESEGKVVLKCTKCKAEMPPYILNNFLHPFLV